MAKSVPEIPSASMADIAFLLLTFFLVTTTISNDRGLSIALPPPPEPNQDQEVKINERNLFKIQINSVDGLLVEGEPQDDVLELKNEIKRFIINNDRDPKSSVSPEKAIVSIKTDRGTSHKRFIQILDIAQGAYYDLWAEQAGVTNKQFREAASQQSVASQREIYEKGKKGIPMNISIAEPTKVGE